RKKYRKMRMRFDDAMRVSNNYFRDEHKAVLLARRLQEQNDQLMDLLLDLNEEPHIPINLRYDLSAPAPSQSDVPSLVPDADTDHATTKRKLHEMRDQLAAGTLDAEEFGRLEAELASKLSAVGGKSLAALLEQVPHTHYSPEQPVPEEALDEMNYLSQGHEDEYLAALDNALGDTSMYDPLDPSGRPIRYGERVIPSDKELQLRNPDSVYNWLRKHQPQVFLQDRENGDGGAEAAPAKPGKGRGGGKKKAAAEAAAAAAAVTPVQQRMEGDIDEEISFVPETGSGRGRRNKDDDAYRPKGGSNRATKRKREDGESTRGGRGKKARAS
ncbi:hypothetical protein K490DRAFT_10242, partial [Saccharata proteae CBS 121410]